MEEALSHIGDGASIMVNGFMGVKSPERIIDGIVAKGVKNLTVICNDSAVPGKGVGKLIANKRVKKLVASHIGLNPETGAQFMAGELDCELIPQGTLVERIRCGGAGLGGFLTPTGVGTEVADGKKQLNVGGTDYLLELPLRADVAILSGSIVDKLGNVYYRGTTKNFSPVMAMAADVVIVEAERIVEIGEIDPDCVMTPSMFVDYVVGR